MALLSDVVNVAVNVEGIIDSFELSLSTANNMVVFDPKRVKDAFREFGRPTGGAGKSLTKKVGDFAQSKAGASLSLIDSFFRFTLNPQQFRVTEAKLDTMVLTKESFDSMHWEHDDTVKLSYSGTSGSLIPPPAARANKIHDIRLSGAWRRFTRFKSFWRAARRDLVIIWDGVYYRGIMRTFNYNQDAENPWQILYTFDFEGFPDQIKDIQGILSVAGLGFSSASGANVAEKVASNAVKKQFV